MKQKARSTSPLAKSAMPATTPPTDSYAVEQKPSWATMAQHLRGVDLEDELLGHPGALDEPHIGPGQERLQGLGKVPQPVAHGHVALAAEGGVVVDADAFHVSVCR